MDVPGLDPTSSSGKFVRYLLVRLAEFQSDQISDTWKSVHRHLARNGRPVGGQTTAFGYVYDVDTQTLQIGTRAAAIVAEMFDRFLAGESAYRIANDMKLRGIATPRGGACQRTKMRDMFRNAAYAGFRKFDGELIPATWRAIIDRDTWGPAQALLDATTRAATKTAPDGKRYGHRPRGTGVYMLSGILRCGECGEAVYHHGNPNKKSAVYCCPTACNGAGIIAAHRAEAYVLNEVGRRWPSIREHVTKPPKPKAKANMYDKRLRELEKRARNLIDSLAEFGPLVGAEIKAQLKDVERQRAEIETRKAELAAQEVRRDMTVTMSRKIAGEWVEQERVYLSDGEAPRGPFDLLALDAR